ncbi:hypothetical protein AX15_004745 [Amanita polypyramis BW_CC]|nr:hypothetical protein AX15_004745 [Amanita polypyramis BW_CC]
MASQSRKSYAQVTALEKASALGHALLMPGVIFWSLCTWYFHAETRAKRFLRLINDVSLYHISKLEMSKLQYVIGTTDQVYRSWAEKSNVPVVVEELGEGAKLYWLGPKRPDRVILYLHGGAFLIPMFPSALSFWKYVQEHLSKGECETGIAILQYTFVPDAVFPVQLKQTVLALQHLLDLGVHPQDIQLGGDSAGANLIFQLLSHMLHPVDNVPTVKLDTPLRGACLISPWILMDGIHEYPSFKNEHDIINGGVARYWGRLLSEGSPEKYTPYIQALRAPDAWFEGIDHIVDRLLITTGDIDLLRDTIVEFKGMIERHHPDVGFILQEHGVHDGPLFDFVSKNPDVSKTTGGILEWYTSGYKQ